MKRVTILFTLLASLQSGCYCQVTERIDSSFNHTEENIIFTKVEVEANPEGKVSWSKFLKKNINYDIASFNGAPQGVYVVKIRFTVFMDGHVGDFEALTNRGYGMEEEVIRALKKSPNWVPAYQNGKPVNAYRIQPITFSVDNQ